MALKREALLLLQVGPALPPAQRLPWGSHSPSTQSPQWVLTQIEQGPSSLTLIKSLDLSDLHSSFY